MTATIIFNCLLGLILVFQSTQSLEIATLKQHNFIENGERSIVLVIASYNNREWYQRNLNSIFSQKYSNYRVIYIDDYSSDGTADLVEQYVNDQGQGHRFLLIKNDSRRYKMANIYRAYHMCNDSDIIIELDGDDWLMHDQVFARYNQIYADPNVWMTYGNFMEWPTNRPQMMSLIEDEVIQSNSFRKKKKCCFWAGLRTYYAWLVKQIALKEFIFKGEFLTMTSDTAIMLPMFEMASTRYAFLTEMMLEHNVATSLNDHKVNYELQFEAFCHIMALEPYKKLDRPILNSFEPCEAKHINLYVCSHRSPTQLAQFLESLKNCIGLGDIVVLYNARDHEQAIEYEMIFQEYPHVIAIEEESDIKGGELISMACNGISDYCMFAQDTYVVNHPIDLHQCINLLERTKAHAFFLTVNKESMHNTKYIWIQDDIYGWQLSFGGRQLQSGNTFSIALYRTSDIQKFYKNCPSDYWSSFSRFLLEMGKQDLSNVGLFFKEAAVIIMDKKKERK
jgi:glycosyltransferase involved in cell wall biosynthesis